MPGNKLLGDKDSKNESPQESIRPDIPGLHDDLGVDPETRRAEADDLERQFDMPSADNTGPGISAAESAGATQKSTKADQDESNKLGKGYKQEKRTSPFGGIKSRFNKMSKPKKYGVVFAAGGGIIGLVTMMVGLFSLLGIFRIDHFLDNIESKAFIRYQVNMEGRSSKWINTYLVLRLSEVDDPNVAPENRDNLIFRSNRVDTNSPLTDWYKTMRASAFETEVFEKHGIKIASIAKVEGGRTKFRPAVITINDEPIKFNLTDTEIKDIEDGNINGLNGRLRDFVNVEVLDSDKAGRRAIKQLVKDNTKSYQYVKRYYLREAIKNQTGTRDWRFFEKTRDNVDDKKISIRNRAIQKAFPESARSGKLIQCLFGITSCKVQPDPADPLTHSEAPANNETCSTNPAACNRGDDDGNPDTPDFVNDDSALTGVASGSTETTDSIQKSIIRSLVGKLSGPAAIISTLDTLNSVDKAIGGSALVSMIYMARQSQAIGVFTMFGIARDQVHTGEVATPELNEFAQIIAYAGMSEGWNK